MKKILLMIICVATLGTMFCDKGYAEAYVHDGFFLRLAPGFGWNSTSEEYGGNTFKMSGVSGLFNFAIGGAVAQDLILQLDVSGVSTSDPKVKLNGNDQSSSISSASTSLAGIGMTYYLPSNFYLTGAVGMAESAYKSNGTTYKTDNGYGANVIVGKEWWVSDNWGVGLAGQFLYTVCPTKSIGGVKSDVTSTSFGLLLSATYN